MLGSTHLATVGGDGESNRSHAVLIVTSFVTAASFLLVITRLISRRWLLHRLSADDWIIAGAWLIALGMSFSICYATVFGLGMRGQEIQSTWEPTLRRLTYASDVLYNPALMATKTSILVLYFRLFSASQVFKRFNVATIVVVNAGGLALTLLNAFQCSPPGAVFQPTVQNAHCTSVLTIYLSSAPLNILTDIAILLLPMPILSTLSMPRKQRSILIVTFGFGIFVTIIDVVRVAYLQAAVREEFDTAIAGRPDLYGTDSDFYWDASLSFMWSAVEVHVGIFCACIPTLKPLAAKVIPWLLKSSSRMPDPDLTSWNGAGGQQDRPSSRHGHRGARKQSDRPGDDQIPLRNMRQRSSITLRLPPTNARKSLVYLSSGEAVRPFLTFTALFFVWGFEYGVLDLLNLQFQGVAGMTTRQTSALHSAYYTGYFFGPLCTGYLALLRWGFKATSIVGLGIYACGTLIFWPAAVLTSFPAAFITNFIVGFGLSNLEVAANPFIILCGPVEYGAARLCLSQGVQAVGTLIASVIATSTFANPSAVGTPSLIDSQWAYLGMSFFTVVLGVLVGTIPLPDANIDQLEDAVPHSSTKIGGIPTGFVVLGLGVVAMFFYVGGQEVNGTTVGSYLSASEPTWNANNYMAVSHAMFAVSRFLCALLALYFAPRLLLLALYFAPRLLLLALYLAPRLLLLAFSLGLVIMEILAASGHVSDKAGAVFAVAAFFMEGPIYPVIFTLALQWLGRHTKLAAVCLSMAVSGGAVFSPIALAVQQSRPGGRSNRPFRRCRHLCRHPPLSRRDQRAPQRAAPLRWRC